jgi:putative ABC transport system permease protein
VDASRFRSLWPRSIPRLDESGINAPVLAFAAILMVAVATILAVAPLWQVLGRRGATSGLPTRDRGSSRRSAALRHGVIVGEMALTMVLLLGSLLLIRSFRQLQDVDPGFAVENRFIARIALPRASYRNPESVTRFADRLTEELKRVPGVHSVGGGNVAPLSGVLATVDFAVEGKPPGDPNGLPSAQFRVITDDYLAALGVPLMRGRGFSESDRASSVPVALVNRHLAEVFFGDENPIGHSILMDDSTVGMRPRQIVVWCATFVR